MDQREPKPSLDNPQLELPLKASRLDAEASMLPRRTAPSPSPARAFRVIKGGGVRRDERLRNRNDVARLLVAAAADVLLHRITPDRAHAIEERVDRVTRLFERVDAEPAMLPILRRELDELEAVWREGERRRSPR